MLTDALQLRTVAVVNGQKNENQPAFWVGFREDAAAGYAIGADGSPVLAAIVVYRPTTESLRGIRLSELQPLDPTVARRVFDQPSPPSAGELRTPKKLHRVRRSPSLVDIKRLADARGLTDALVARSAADAAEQAASPELLQRVDQEAPVEFYRRVKRAHDALSRVTDRPTSELARRAGVKVGTAAAWVSRANAMAKQGKL